MSEKNLIICDSSFSYASFLMENILEKEELSVHVHVCTCWENVEKLLKEEPADILLVDEKWKEDAKATVDVRQIAILTEQRLPNSKQEERQICRYQSADVIVANLFEGTGVFQRMQDEKQRMIVVYSPLHRVGKTTFAMALAKELARKEKTLYLNLEEYPVLNLGYVNETKETLSDLLYYIKQDCEDVGLRLSSIVQQEEKMEYILPIPLCSDLKEISVNEWKKLFFKLRETRYENIVVDLSESVQGLYEFLAESDRIYMPVLSDEISKAKLTCYEENLKKHGLEKLYYKTRKLEIEGDAIDETVRRIAREDFGTVGFIKGDCR